MTIELELECKRCADILIPVIRGALRPLEWCVGVHGSLARDIDLIVVPWRFNATRSDLAAVTIRHTIIIHFPQASILRVETFAHNREAFTMGLGNGIYVDCSIFNC